MLIAEYDYDTDIEVQREEAMERGREEGREEGREDLMRKLLKIGIPEEKLMEVSGYTREKIKSLC